MAQNCDYMTNPTRKGRIARFVDAFKAGVKAFRDSAPLHEEPKELRKNAPVQAPFPQVLMQKRERKMHEAGLSESQAGLMRPLDVELYTAVGANNAAQIRAAVRRGADLEARHLWMPQFRDGDCIEMEQLTPLSYARKIGNLDAIIALTELGAKD